NEAFMGFLPGSRCCSKRRTLCHLRPFQPLLPVSSIPPRAFREPDPCLWVGSFDSVAAARVSSTRVDLMYLSIVVIARALAPSAQNAISRIGAPSEGGSPCSKNLTRFL